MKKKIRPTTSVVPCPVVLLSVAGSPKPNIITLSWVANVCSEPPTVAVGIRPSRYSHALVKDAGDFVLNIPSKDLLDASMFCGTKSGKEYDKFAECDITAIKASKVASPMIKECPINIECETRQIVNLGAHDLFIAEVVAVHVDECVLNDLGRFSPEKTVLFTYLPLSGQYWSLGERIGK